MIGLLPISLGLMSVAGAIGAIDALYFHLQKYALFARAASKREHLVHTLRGVLLPLALWLGYASPRTTATLMVFGLVELADFALVVWDVSIEHASRRELGALSRGEYLVHVVATTLHSGAIALALASWPAEAWLLEPFAETTPQPWVAMLARLATFGAIAIALLHVALMHPRVSARARA